MGKKCYQWIPFWWNIAIAYILDEIFKEIRPMNLFNFRKKWKIKKWMNMPFDLIFNKSSEPFNFYLDIENLSFYSSCWKEKKIKWQYTTLEFFIEEGCFHTIV